MPIDRAQLDQQLNELPDSARWSNRPEIHDLAAVMEPGERALAGGTAWLIEKGKLAVRTWVAICTTERLICLLKGGPGGVRKVELAADRMKAAYTDARLGYHEVIVESNEEKTILSGMPKDSAVALCAALSSQIVMRQQGLHATTQAGIDIPASEPPLPAPAAIMAIPTGQAANVGTDITLRELAAYVEKVQRLEREMLQAQKRLAAIEDVIRRAAARSSAPGNAAT